MRKSIIYFLIAVIFTSNFSGCGLVYNKSFYPDKIQIKSVPSGAAFTIQDGAGNSILLARYFTLHDNHGNQYIQPERFTIFNHDRSLVYTAQRSSDGLNYTLENQSGYVTSLPIEPMFGTSTSGSRISIDVRYSSNTLSARITTPETVQWKTNYSQVVFDMAGYPSQTERLKKTKVNWGFWSNFLGIAYGVLFFFDTVKEGDSKPSGGYYTPEEADKHNSDSKGFATTVVSIGALSVLVDILSGNVMSYSNNITADMTRQPRAPSPRRTEIRQGIESTVERAIAEAMTNVPRNSIIVMDQVSGGDAVLRAFITSETEFVLVNQGFRVVDRVQWDRIRAEQGFMLTDEVDSSTAVNLGRIAGASHIVTGIIEGEGQLRRLRLRVMETQTADLIGTASVPYGDSR